MAGMLTDQYDSVPCLSTFEFWIGMRVHMRFFSVPFAPRAL